MKNAIPPSMIVMIDTQAKDTLSGEQSAGITKPVSSEVIFVQVI